MSEKIFINNILEEGCLLLFISLCILILPKISPISFGSTVCTSFTVYGIFKIYSAIKSKNYIKNYIFELILGIIIFLCGLLLPAGNMFNISFLNAILGLYMVLSAISSVYFGYASKQSISLWWFNFAAAFVKIFCGFLIILGLPATALWFIGIIYGFNFFVEGFLKICMYISAKYSY